MTGHPIDVGRADRLARKHLVEVFAIAIGVAVLLLGTAVVLGLMAVRMKVPAAFFDSRLAIYSTCAWPAYAATAFGAYGGLRRVAVSGPLMKISIAVQALAGLGAWIALDGVLTMPLLPLLATAYMAHQLFNDPNDQRPGP